MNASNIVNDAWTDGPTVKEHTSVSQSYGINTQKVARCSSWQAQEKFVVSDSEESMIDSNTDSYEDVDYFTLHNAAVNDNNDQDNNNVQDFIWENMLS